jgi:beta-phosphoglucomutase-like phosphatase (HAD superfamily)
MEKLERVIFDCGGVLVESEGMSQRISWEVAAAHGIPDSEDEIARRYLGVSDDEMMIDLERRHGVTLPSGFRNELLDRKLQAVARDGVPEIPGAKEAVAAVVRAGLLTCVASSGTHPEIDSKLRPLGFLDLFGGHIFSASNVEKGKPEPDLFLHAASAMGVPPARSVVVEDSVNGVLAAVAAGMRVVGYAPDDDRLDLA